MTRHAWVDASAGVAGDMLFGALLDAGADLDVVRAAVEAVLPGEVEIDVERIARAGLAASRVVVRLSSEPPDRGWAELRARITQSPLQDPVRDAALATFSLLAEVEAEVHGVDVDEVHFHEVGAWDSVADVVGVHAAVADLGIGRLTCGPVGLGSGTVRTQHGVMAVPVPAVLGVLERSGLEAAGPDLGGNLVGECATPTGVALLATLCQSRLPAPDGQVVAVGVGAGARDPAERANVTRVVLYVPRAAEDGTSAPDPDDLEERVLVEVAATVDDLDPRVWPSVQEELLAHGALDAWLVPVQMKKGRPGIVITALADPSDRERVVDVLLAHTPTLGVRWHEVRRSALQRSWRELTVLGQQVRVKVGSRQGRIVTVTPELEDCREVALRRRIPLRVVLRAAEAAATTAGWQTGARL